MYQKVYFEISGICNARCPWCVTGNQSLGKKSSCSSKFIKPVDFERAIDRLMEIGLINSSSCISLFNWGEPLLHPEFEKILEVLHVRGIDFIISTNASKPVTIKKNLMSNMQAVAFSMPGYSKESYDKIHGFNFEKIVKNIDLLLRTFRKSGFVGTPILSYHIYQFNIDEIHSAVEFCSKKGIDFLPTVAFINDFNLMKAYLDGTMDCELLEKASKDLLLYYVDDLVKHAPKDYHCPQYDSLTMDENCNVLTCCGVPKNHSDYTIGNLFDLSAAEILSKKTSQSVCTECISSGLAYWVHNPCHPDFVQDIVGRSLFKKICRNRNALVRKLRTIYNRGF